MMADPIAVLDTGLYTKLNIPAVTNLAVGGIWALIAPKGTALPYVIFQWQGGGDANLTPSRIRNVVYTVKALALTKSAAANIAEQVDLALHNQTLTVTGWVNWATTREDDVQLAEVMEDGRVVYHMGAIYRFRMGV